MSTFNTPDPTDPSSATATPTPTTTTNTENPLLGTSNPNVSDLEQDVLDEYTRLLGNVNKVPT